MGLRFEAGDFNDLGLTLRNDSIRSERKVREKMRKTVNQVKDLSVRMAPVDLHNLEQAHKVVEERGSRNRIEFSVEVGGVVGGRDVSDYAALVHENYGSLKPGPKTLAKMSANPDIKVGEKFLERAFEHYAADIEDDIAEAVVAEFL